MMETCVKEVAALEVIIKISKSLICDSSTFLNKEFCIFVCIVFFFLIKAEIDNIVAQ